MTVEVDGTPVTVANADGTWCAFEHMCPHQATPLGGLPLMRERAPALPRARLDLRRHHRPVRAALRRRLVRHRCARSAPQVVDDVVQVSLH